MAQVLKGRTGASEIPNMQVGNIGAQILDIIQIGNSQEIQSTEVLNNILSNLEVVKGVSRGSKLPIEHFNVYFQPGGVETASVEMKKYFEAFEMLSSPGYNVMAFDYSLEDEVAKENEGIDLNAEAVDKVANITRAYTANYLPYSRLAALLTGTSLTAKCPTKTSGDRSYSEAFGFLRGEDASEWLLPTAKDKNRNHYRTIKGSNVNESDIYGIVRMLSSYRTYSRRGIIALASPTNIQRVLGSSYTAPTNVDEVIVNNNILAPKPFGCEWIGIPELEGHDFIIFLDKGRYDILFRRVEPSEKYRGLGILMKNNITAFEGVTDIEGAKLRIFPEEWYLIGREAGAILDINPSRKNASGEMDTASIEALENLATLCLGAYDIEHRMAQK